MNILRVSNRLLAVLLVITSGQLRAEVKMPAIFGDHMVLQQNLALPVWGTADPGEQVTVTVGTSSGKTIANADGKWMVKLTPLPAGTAPLTMTVVGKNTLIFQNVIAGDVWVCSGQSNMEFSLSGAHNASTETPKATDPQLRFFIVTKKTALDPLTDLTGTWVLCTPETAKGFSAVGYFFGRDLRSHLKRPIGLIGTYWGGTPAQAWTSFSALQKEPSLKYYVDVHTKLQASYSPQAEADYQAKHTAWMAERAKWDQTVGAAFGLTLIEWNKAVTKAIADKQPPPPKPIPSPAAPAAPIPADGGSNAPSNLFNAMIAPLIPYGINGAIWYQGESNAGQPVEYRTLFADMITDWRTHWSQGDFPFLFVQLAKYQEPNLNWAELRNAQFETLALPNTGMATAIDVGDQGNIHPKDKMDVGHRLALAARHVAYGEKLVYSGPIYDKIEVNGNKVRVHFTHIGGGLVIGKAPWIPDGATPLPTDSLAGFTVAGTDKKFVSAQAKISGHTVAVSSPEVSQPVAVRYAFESGTGNLYNKEGLPALPFRSDDGKAPVVVPATQPSAVPAVPAVPVKPTPKPPVVPPQPRQMPD